MFTDVKELVKQSLDIWSVLSHESTSNTNDSFIETIIGEAFSLIPVALIA
jgi:hypothetical protein